MINVFNRNKKNFDGAIAVRNSIRNPYFNMVKLDKYYGEWKLLPKPSVNELYPNMNIKYGKWNTEKKILADEIEEITLVWNISYKNRCILIDKGITKWSDPILLTNIYSYQIKENKRLEEAKELLADIKKLKIEFKKEADENNQLYGAISKKEIINFLKEKEIKILADDIKINLPIRSLGEHTIEINPYDGLLEEIKVFVKKN